MPCTDGRDNKTVTVSDPNDRKKINKLTRMLCSTLRTIEQMGTTLQPNPISKLGTEVNDWWKAHKIADKKRETAEKIERNRQQAKRRALKKLTLREKTLLGLKSKL